MDTITRLLNIFGEATIPMLVLVTFSALLIGKVAIAERDRRSLKASLRKLLADAVRQASADTGLLLFFDRESQEVFADIAIGIDDEFFIRRGLRRGVGVSGRVLETGQPVIVSDLFEDERFQNHPMRDELRQRHIVSVVSLPIHLANRVIGVMTLSSRTPNHFTEAQIPTLLPAAENIGLAVGNAQIFEVTRTNWES